MLHRLRNKTQAPGLPFGPSPGALRPPGRMSSARRPSAGLQPLILSLMLSLAPGAVAQQFQFFLRNGDRLTGSLVAEDKDSVIITNGILGRVLIPAGQVERREPFPGPASAVTAPVRPPPPVPPVTQSLTAVQKRRLDDLLQVYTADQISAAEFQRRRMEILTPAPTPAPGTKHWSGELMAGVDLGYGTKDRQYFSGRAKLNYVTKRVRNTLDYLFTYGHTDGELSADRMDTSDKIDFELRSNYYLYGLAGAGYDEVRKIDYYIQGGPGFGRHLLQRSNLVVNAEIGATYQVQDFADSPNTDVFYYRLGQELKWTIAPKVTFDEKLDYTPQWDDPGQFKLRVEANLKFWMLTSLSLNLTVIDLYDTRVASSIDRNDLQIRSSIGVKF